MFIKNHSHDTFINAQFILKSITYNIDVDFTLVPQVEPNENKLIYFLYYLGFLTSMDYLIYLQS